MLQHLLNPAAAGTEGLILERLGAADDQTLRRTKRIKAVAILYEHDPTGRQGEAVPWPRLFSLVNSILGGLQANGWVPTWLEADAETPIVKRQLRQGEEIGPGVGLTGRGYNAIIARMLAELVDVNELPGWQAIGFRGDSVALGFHVVGLIAV